MRRRTFQQAWLLGVSLSCLVGARLDLPRLAAAEKRCAVLEVFLRGDAERSQAARKFLEATYANRRGVQMVIRDVAESERDLNRFWKLAERFKIEKPGLPAFYVSGRFEYGWDREATPARIEETLTVEVFVRKGCPRCAAAHPVLFEQLAPRYPGYRFIAQDIATSREAQDRLQSLSQRYRVQAASVPAVHICGKLMVGFQDAATNYRQWDDVLKAVTIACPEETDKPNRASGDDGQAAAGHGRGGWLTGAVYAGEPVATPSDDVASPDADGPATPEEIGGLGADEADAPPSRRELPSEMPAETDPPAPLGENSAVTSDVVMLPLLGEVRWRDWGLPAFTLVVGLIDGFNPCAMWVLLFLLSLLVNLRDRWKIFAVAGTFVAISGLAYLAFMAAWLSIFQLIGLLRPAQICLGLLGIAVGTIHVKDFFAFKKGVSLSIPESAKPGLYERMRRIVLAESLWAALLGATVLAVLVNVIELLCTAGLPAMYTNILALQQFPIWLNYAYLILYIAAYMFDDSLMVAIVVVTLGRHKLQERGGRALKLISGLVIAGLGFVMIFKPEWLV